jgi:hypothetical protein
MRGELWVVAACGVALYAVAFVTGWALSSRRTRARVLRELTADPALLRRLAARVEEARFTAAAADATRRVGGLAPREPRD